MLIDIKDLPQLTGPTYDLDQAVWVLEKLLDMPQEQTQKQEAQAEPTEDDGGAKEPPWAGIDWNNLSWDPDEEGAYWQAQFEARKERMI